MKCPYCSGEDTKVTDKRDNENITRRRRECLKCERRFTTYERFELDLSVIKKDGKREKFDRDKLIRGIEKNLEKRPFTSEQTEELMNDIVARIYKAAQDKDIKSSKIGQIVMDKLKRVDKVAYIRFAAVYRDFADLDDFKDEIAKISRKKS